MPAKKIEIVAFAGSLRKGSYNRTLLNTASERAPNGTQIRSVEVGDIPFFNADVEIKGDPSSVLRLKDDVRNADGLLVFTPEYNGSVSAVTKNAIDWLSRKTGEYGSPMSGKAVGIAAASPGRRGAPGARSDLLRIVGYMTDQLFQETLAVPGISNKLDEHNRLTDPTTLVELDQWLERFVNHVRQAVTEGSAA